MAEQSKPRHPKKIMKSFADPHLSTKTSVWTLNVLTLFNLENVYQANQKAAYSKYVTFSKVRDDKLTAVC